MPEQVSRVSHNTWPQQGEHIGFRTSVLCHGDPSDKHLLGVIVREDMEQPYMTLIFLDDGRLLEAKECHYTPMYGVGADDTEANKVVALDAMKTAMAFQNTSNVFPQEA